MRRIVLVQTAFLGDTVFTSALARSLHARFPEAELDMCVSPRGRDVALTIPGVSGTVVFDKRGRDRGVRGLWRLGRRLRERRYDLAVLPHRSLRSALLARLSGARARVGFAGTPGRLFYTAVAPDAGATFLDREANLARALGAVPSGMKLEPRPAAMRAARERLEAAGVPETARVAAICVGSEWPTKVWPVRHAARLAGLLRSRGFVPMLLGGPREQGLSAEILRLAPEASCLDTTGNSVGEAIALLALSTVCVGGDTGLVHAARALGIPTVALFGPTAPEVHRLAERDRAVSLRLACSPCSAHGSWRCPLGHHDCLERLSAEMALAACLAACGSA